MNDEFLPDDSADADEPGPIETGAAQLNVVVTGWDAARVNDRIAEHVAQKLRVAAEKKLDAAIADALAPVIGEAVEARVGAVVDRILADGWTETDRYGNVRGRKITVRERIEEALKPGTGYNEHYKGLPGIVDSRIRAAFDKELESAVKRVREQVDAIIATALDAAVTDRIKVAIGNAFGIKVPK